MQEPEAEVEEEGAALAAPASAEALDSGAAGRRQARKRARS